jgi:hypothetical protein
LVKILGDTPSNLDEQILQDIEQIRRKISWQTVRKTV